jgi:hypothetical protein
MYFSCFAKKSTKRRRLKEALRKCALLENPPAASPVSAKKYSDFWTLTTQNLPVFSM